MTQSTLALENSNHCLLVENAVAGNVIEVVDSNSRAPLFFEHHYRALLLEPPRLGLKESTSNRQELSNRFFNGLENNLLPELLLACLGINLEQLLGTCSSTFPPP